MECLFDEPFGFELLVEGSDGIGNEVAVVGVEGSAGDGVVELALDGVDEGFGGGIEVHGCCWAFVMVCRLGLAGLVVVSGVEGAMRFKRGFMAGCGR